MKETRETRVQSLEKWKSLIKVRLLVKKEMHLLPKLVSHEL